MGTFFECFINSRVHFDVEILLLQNLFVPFPDDLIDPLFEWRANQCVDHVRDVRSRQLQDLALDYWQSFENLRK
jgi:hypothetical protein